MVVVFGIVLGVCCVGDVGLLWWWLLSLNLSFCL